MALSPIHRGEVSYWHSTELVANWENNRLVKTIVETPVKITTGFLGNRVGSNTQSSVKPTGFAPLRSTIWSGLMREPWRSKG